jgi:hypothetical protein
MIVMLLRSTPAIRAKRHTRDSANASSNGTTKRNVSQQVEKKCQQTLVQHAIACYNLGYAADNARAFNAVELATF